MHDESECPNCIATFNNLICPQNSQIIECLPRKHWLLFPIRADPLRPMRCPFVARDATANDRARSGPNQRKQRPFQPQQDAPHSRGMFQNAPSCQWWGIY